MNLRRPFSCALGIVLCASLGVASAQADAGAKARPPSVSKSKLHEEPSKSRYAMVQRDADVGLSASDSCRPSGAKKPVAGVMVVVVRAVECQPHYGGAPVKLFEVLYRGGALYVREDDLLMTDDVKRAVAADDEQSIEANRASWVEDSKYAYLYQLDKAIKALKATAPQGIALIDSSIFDVSEYGEGTGFSVKFLNTGKKTIKYANFSILGLNAVKDPVRERFSRDATVRLRGIGPVEPDSFASYSKDYMWMSDFVEYHRITQIKLEFMDGTSKTISDIKRIKVDSSVYDLLTDDSE